MPFAIDESYELAVTLPDSVVLLNPLNMIDKKDSFGEMMIEIAQSGNTVNIKRSIKITQNTIPVSSYKKFKEMIDLWNEKKFKELMVKKL